MRLGPFTIPLCLLIFCCGCSHRIGDDLWSHGIFSAAASGAVTAATEDYVLGVSVSFSIGLLKEVYDLLRGSGFCFNDLAADFAGSVVGALGTTAAMEGSFCLTR